MKKIVVGVLLTLMLIGCDAGSTRNSTYEEVPAENVGSGGVTVTSGGDATVTQTVVTDEGKYITTEGGDIIYVGGDYYEADSSSGSGSMASQGEYNPDYSEKTCKEEGFFWCTIEQKCLNQPAQGGTCSG